MLTKIEQGSLKEAQRAFKQLKKLGNCKRNAEFLVPNDNHGIQEDNFAHELGIDVMKIAEGYLITRPDYIKKYANKDSYNVINSYKEKCDNLHKKNDWKALFQERHSLKKRLSAGHKNFETKVCLAFIENKLHALLLMILNDIIYSPNLSMAHKHLVNLEKQMLQQAHQRNITLESELIKFFIDQYGFDILQVARDYYKSRSDFVDTPENKSILSDAFNTIVYNIKFNSLPKAHAELVHFDKQISDGLKFRDITNPIEQKNYLAKHFGGDVVNMMHCAYKERSDHQKLVENFVPIDVKNNTIEILSNNKDYKTISYKFENIAKQVIDNAKLCNLSYVDHVEDAVVDTLHVMHHATNPVEFVYNATIVDHLLSDLQHTTENIVQGKETFIERTPCLLLRAVEKFINGLNPITQAHQIGELVSDVTHIAWDGITHPISTSQSLIHITGKACEFLVNTAHLTSDATIGKYYLSSAEYEKRCNDFSKAVQDMPITQLTAEQWVDITAQLAADFVVGKGILSTFNYLKKIDALGKMHAEGAKVINTLKKAVDTHLAENPLLITAEGIVVKMSSEMKELGGIGKEIITSSRALIDSMTHGILSEVRKDIIVLTEKLTCIEKGVPECAKKGFNEFKNGHIKIAYEHILGIELIWNDAKILYQVLVDFIMISWVV